jgi:NADPH:quinone reductase-like Zn-dependent oxidoreductase
VRAAVRDRYGSPDVVEVRDMPDPEPGPGEVLVRVTVASVNRADLDGLYPRWPILRLVYGVRRPRVPWIGLDAAGVVERVGEGVSRFAPGDRVFSDLYGFGQKAFAELVAAPERAWLPIPEGMDDETAATLPHSGVLAVQGLRRRGATPGQGDHVLIDGASGNVGPFAIQVAKALGAEVTGTASPSKLEFVRSLGADHAIDYTSTDYTRGGTRYDWILDVDSHHSILDARRALRKGGVYQTLGGTMRRIGASLTVGPVVSLATGRRMGLMLAWKPFEPASIDALAKLHSEGRLRAPIDSRHPLEHAAEAIRRVDDGKAMGKVLIIPGTAASTVTDGATPEPGLHPIA